MLVVKEGLLLVLDNILESRGQKERQHSKLHQVMEIGENLVGRDDENSVLNTLGRYLDWITIFLQFIIE